MMAVTKKHSNRALIQALAFQRTDLTTQIAEQSFRRQLIKVWYESEINTFTNRLRAYPWDLVMIDFDDFPEHCIPDHGPSFIPHHIPILMMSHKDPKEAWTGIRYFNPRFYAEKPIPHLRLVDLIWWLAKKERRESPRYIDPMAAEIRIKKPLMAHQEALPVRNLTSKGLFFTSPVAVPQSDESWVVELMIPEFQFKEVSGCRLIHQEVEHKDNHLVYSYGVEIFARSTDFLDLLAQNTIKTV